MFYVILHLALSLEISPIPSSMSPPTVRRSLSAVYSSSQNSAFFYGGCKFSADTYSNIMWQFNLTSNTWIHLDMRTSLLPETRYGASMGIYKDLIYAYGGATHLGPSAELWTYNITNNIWEEMKPLGDRPIELSMSGFCSFEWESQSWFAVFGGNSMHSSGTNELYIMNFGTQEWKRMPKQGIIPAERLGSGLVYYNDSLYMWGISEKNRSVEENQRLYKYSLKEEKWSVIETYGQVAETRNHHGVALVENYLYVFLGIDHHSNKEFSSTYKVNLLDGKWEKVVMTGEVITRNKFGLVQNGKSAWVICGTNSKGLFNSVYKYDFSNNTILTIIKSTKMPKRRHSYSFNKIGSNIVMFGGYDYDLVFSDLLIWDIQKNSWFDRIPSGSAPSPRFHHCSTVYQGLNLIIFGGEDSKGSFSEFYLYNFDRNSWSIIKTDISVSKKTFCCMTTYKNFIIVHGGKTTQSSASDEVLVLNMNTRTLRVFPSYSSKNADVNLMNHKCWVTEKNNTSWLILSIGERSDLSPSSSIYKTNITDFWDKNSLYWTVLKDTSNNTIVNWASSGYALMNDWLIQVGGSRLVLYASSLINVIPLSQNIDPQTLSNESSNIFWHKHGVEHFGNKLIIAYSGATSGDLIKKEFVTSQMYKISPNDKDKQFFLCSTGTYGPDCLPCPLGSYSDIIGAEECKKCPAGTMGTYVAATSLYMCLPCPFGSFSADEGTVMCKECMSGLFCPVGSTEDTLVLDAPSIIIIRPEAYSKTLPDPFDGKVYYIVYFFSAALLIGSWSWAWVRRKIRRIDYFSEKHNTEENEPIIKLKTTIGGIVTIAFSSFALIYITGLLNMYFNDNIIEEKSLIPLVTLNENFIVSIFTITIELFYYRGDCVDMTNQDNCIFDLYTETYGIGWTRTCKKAKPSTCIVELSCTNCELLGNEDIINKICEFGSFASGIRVTVLSDSSIPGYMSSVSYYINHDDGKVFRGTEPSVFFYGVTRSLFLSEPSEWPSIKKGYHIAPESNPTIGSSYEGKDINLETCLQFQVKLEMTNSILVIQRKYILSFIMLVSTGIGSIFGFLELFGIGMLVFEKVEDYAYKKIRARKSTMSIVKNRIGIMLSFDHVKTTVRLRKSWTSTFEGYFSQILNKKPNDSILVEELS